MKPNYIIALCLGLGLAACNKSTDTTTSSAESATPTTSIEQIILTEAPAQALSVSEARKQIEVGKQITVAGKIMGRMDPFVEGRAVFIIGDPAKITSCDLMEDDHCQTPWDVCCDDPDVIKASIATIKILDADGKLLEQGVKGVSGIKELSEVIVTGKIAKESNADVLVISATGIYLKQ